MRRVLMFIALVSLALSSFVGVGAAAQDATPPGTPCPSPAEAELEAIADQYFDAFNTGDVDALDALLAPDFIHYGAIGPDQDRELHKERVLITRAGFPDAVYTMDEVMTDGDLVLIRHTMRGTHEEDYAGLAPTGTAVEVTGIHIHRVECGQIVESWNEGDALGLYQQIGLLPAPIGATPVAEEAAPAASPVACPSTTDAERQALVERWFEAAWEQGDVEVLDEILAGDHAHHWAIGPDTAGVDPVQDQIARWHVAFPDLQATIDGTMMEGDLVAVRWTATGTFDGPFGQAEPSGASFEVTGINIFRVECGQIAEVWSEMDGVGMFRQLGLAPDPVATPAS